MCRCHDFFLKIKLDVIFAELILCSGSNLRERAMFISNLSMDLNNGSLFDLHVKFNWGDKKNRSFHLAQKKTPF